MKKILIVDDDKRVVRMLEEYMKLYNFQTLCAGNGKDALALYDETVDLIILDINMQGMDGVEVCRRIRKQGNVPIIMLSANAASFDKVEALGAGADDYIVKPFDPVEPPPEYAPISGARNGSRHPGPWKRRLNLMAIRYTGAPTGSQRMTRKSVCPIRNSAFYFTSLIMRLMRSAGNKSWSMCGKAIFTMKIS